MRPMDDSQWEIKSALAVVIVLSVIISLQVGPQLGYEWEEDEQYLNDKCEYRLGDGWEKAAGQVQFRQVNDSHFAAGFYNCTNGTDTKTIRAHRENDLVPA